MEQYSLRVESGRGFDLNISLFERLVKGGYPHTTLELQHRMPPEVRQAIGMPPWETNKSRRGYASQT